MTFDHNRIIITGAAGGIGGAIARRMSEAGVRLALFDLDARVHEVASGLAGDVRAAVVDLSEPQAIVAAVDEVREAGGPVTGLVNNAAIVDNVAPLHQMALEAWNREVAVNLTAPFVLTRQVLPDMRAAGFGRIVNISSIAARGGLHRQAPYSATKTGILGLTHTTALEYAREGITCNAILPGLIATPKVKAMPQAILDGAIAATPARRPGAADEIAAAVAFLLSNEAAYVNGAEVDVSGGAHLNAMTVSSRKETQGSAGHGDTG